MKSKLDLKRRYLGFCKTYDSHPHDAVIDALERVPSIPEKPTFDLNGSSISIESCQIIGHLLAKDNIIVSVKLNDCVLSDEGGTFIINGLCQNQFVKELDLKGNNLRSSSAEALGRLFRHNHSLKRLILEWNGIGMWESSMAVFSQGLASNNTLEYLDLRSNQITHEGVAELAAALKRNSSLSYIDLRWNCAGILGGRALLSMLPHNKTLNHLNVLGNNVPDDIIKAIDMTVSRNDENRTLSQDYMTRTEILTRELRQLQTEKDSRVTELLSQVDLQERKLNKQQSTIAHKVGELQEALAEKKNQCTQLNSKLKMTESQLVITEQRADELEAMIKRNQQEFAARMQRTTDDIVLERQDRKDAESKYIEELSQHKDKLYDAENKIADLQRRLDTATLQLVDQKDSYAKLDAALRNRATEADERVAIERARLKDFQREADEELARMVEKASHSADDKLRQMRDRNSRLEQQIASNEEELARVKSQSIQDRIAAEDEIADAKQRIRREEEQRAKHLEDKMRLVQNSKDEIQIYANQQSNLVNELQSRVNALTIENEQLKRRSEELIQEVTQKSGEVTQAILKTKSESATIIARLESENISVQEMKDRAIRAERKLNDKERELDDLKAELRRANKEIARMRDDESQRVMVLQNAIHSYVNSAPQSPTDQVCGRMVVFLSFVRVVAMDFLRINNLSVGYASLSDNLQTICMPRYVHKQIHQPIHNMSTGHSLNVSTNEEALF